MSDARDKSKTRKTDPVERPAYLSHFEKLNLRFSTRRLEFSIEIVPGRNPDYTTTSIFEAAGCVRLRVPS